MVRQCGINQVCQQDLPLLQQQEYWLSSGLQTQEKQHRQETQQFIRPNDRPGERPLYHKLLIFSNSVCWSNERQDFFLLAMCCSHYLCFDQGLQFASNTSPGHLLVLITTGCLFCYQRSSFCQLLIWGMHYPVIKVIFNSSLSIWQETLNDSYWLNVKYIFINSCAG